MAVTLSPLAEKGDIVAGDPANITVTLPTPLADGITPMLTVGALSSVAGTVDVARLVMSWGLTVAQMATATGTSSTNPDYSMLPFRITTGTGDGLVPLVGGYLTFRAKWHGRARYQALTAEVTAATMAQVAANAAALSAAAAAGTSDAGIAGVLATPGGAANTVLSSTYGTVADVKAASNVQHSKRCAVVTFVSDDDNAADVSKLRPLSVTYGIPMCAAIITNPFNAATYVDLQNNLGWEICSHTDTHPMLPSLTDAQIATECSASKAKLVAAGLNVNAIVYPGGGNNENVRRIAKQYYRMGVSVSAPAGTNTGVIPSFNIKRVGLGAYFDPTVSGLPATDTLAYYKARVDQAVTEGSWLIFMLHPGDAAFDATQAANLEAVIQYVQSLSIPVMTLSQAFDIFGNAFEAGDYSGSTTGWAVAKDGSYVNIPNGTQIVSKVGLSNASPPASFPAKVVSATSFLSGDAAGFPTIVGTLLTYRLNTDEELSFQMWYDYFAERVFMRRWRTAGWLAWGELVSLATLGINESLHMNLTANAYTGAQLANTYPVNRVTVHFVNGAGTAGYPGAGICTTYHIGGNGWRRQEFRKYQTNEVWARFCSDVDGSWSAWVLISGTGAYTTALRPVDRAVGSTMFDTTLGKPIWLKTVPSVWVDATGAVV